MDVAKLEFQERMAEVPVEILEEVLACAGIEMEGADQTALAQKLADALWWRTHSPAGLLRPSSLGQLTERYAVKLGLELAGPLIDMCRGAR